MARPAWLPAPWLMVTACVLGVAAGAAAPRREPAAGPPDGGAVRSPPPPAADSPAGDRPPSSTENTATASVGHAPPPDDLGVGDGATEGAGAQGPREAGGRTAALPGAPPRDLLLPLREAMVGTFAPRPPRSAAAGAAAPSAADEALVRDAAFRDLAALVDAWRASRRGRDPLAAADWWSPALLAVASPEPDAAGEGGLEVVVPRDDEHLRFALWTPTTREDRARPLPVLVVFLEFSMDPYGTLRTHHGGLLETHAIAMPLLRHPREAGWDRALTDPDVLPRAMALLAERVPLDRDRVAVDGHGRGAALATAAAARHATLLHAAVHRMPWERPAMTGNLGLLANLVITGPEMADPVRDVLVAIREKAWETETLEADDYALSFPSAAPRVREWLLARGARRIRDQREEYRWYGSAAAGAERWGRWFTVDAVETEGEDRVCSVRIRRDRQQNAVILRTENVAVIRLLLNDAFLDLDSPVAVSVNDVWVTPVTPVRDLAVVRRWALRDPSLFVAAEVEVRIPPHARGR